MSLRCLMHANSVAGSASNQQLDGVDKSRIDKVRREVLRLLDPAGDRLAPENADQAQQIIISQLLEYVPAAKRLAVLKVLGSQLPPALLGVIGRLQAGMPELRELGHKINNVVLSSTLIDYLE